MARRNDTDGDFDRQIRSPHIGVPADVIARRDAWLATGIDPGRTLTLSHDPYDDEGAW